MSKRILVVLAIAAALVLTMIRMNAATGDGEADPGTTAQSPPQVSRLPSAPAHVIHDESNGRQFETLGQLVATSAAVVRADVISVNAGPAIQLGDSSGRTVIPRLLTLDVHKVFYGRSTANLPDQLIVNDGYWEDGEGYVREGLDWAQPGATGFYFLSQDRGPDGNLQQTYSLIDTAGRVLIHGNRVRHADAAVWGPEVVTPGDVAIALSAAVADARSGAAKPVLVDVCWPSTPDDENSEPICVKE